MELLTDKIVIICSIVLLCLLGISSLTYHGISNDDIADRSMSVGANVLGAVSMANGTAIKNVDKTGNQLSVVYDNEDVATYSLANKIEKPSPSLSLSMNYVSDEKKSTDFIVMLIKNLLGDDFKGKLNSEDKDKLSFAIENDSSTKLKLVTKGCTMNIDFKQTGNVFNLHVKCAD